MEPATRGTLRTIAAQLAVIVGVIHLGLGTYSAFGGTGGSADDPRIVLWTVVGVALVGGVAVAAIGWRRRHLYVLGVLVIVMLVSVYVLWPVVAAESFYLGPPPATSPVDPLGYVHGQLLQPDPVAKIAVATELALLVLLVLLLHSGDPR